MIREGLGRLIGEVADLVGQVADGRQLVELARRLEPDVIVSDVTMPVMGGVEALRQLKAEGSTARFVFLTVHTEPQLAAEALRAGAYGYLLKAAAGEELFEAIRAAMAGRVYLTSYITRDVLQRISRPSDRDDRLLTSRQREVLQLIAQGKRMKEIAVKLDISVRTVESHKSQLMTILNIKNTADLVKFAVKQGLVPD
jgi:DNA-binding NarL/FixJ family response regulator